MDVTDMVMSDLSQRQIRVPFHEVQEQVMEVAEATMVVP